MLPMVELFKLKEVGIYVKEVGIYVLTLPTKQPWELGQVT